MAAEAVSWRARSMLRRALVEPFDQQLVRELEREIVGSCDSLLDLVCGPASPVGHFSRGLQRCVGVDLFDPYIQESVAAGIHTDYHCLDVMRIDDRFAPGQFDCVMALDLIEHLPREAGLELLTMRGRIRALTPPDNSYGARCHT